jgi:hypothetical protein
MIEIFVMNAGINDLHTVACEQLTAQSKVCYLHHQIRSNQAVSVTDTVSISGRYRAR